MKPHPTYSVVGTLLIYSLLILAPSLCVGAASAANDEDSSRIWIERPWEYRYVIVIEGPSSYDISRFIQKKNIASGKEINFFGLEALFPQNVAITTDPDAVRDRDQAIGAIVVQFDKDGQVLSPNDLSLGLSGRMSRLFNIVLSAGDKPDSWWFLLGHWYTGQSGHELAYTPAICHSSEIPRFQSKYGRYTKGFKSTSGSIDGNFGCREWGYYLQSNKHPYIDVTSYGKDQFGQYSYIRPVLGWGRFDTPPKPVIGKHGKVWVCLHECPNGEAPGIIPDIKAWAKANGWPLPKPPKKQPMFPDREYKRGEFID